MSTQVQPETPEPGHTNRFAPWWIYVLVVAPANLGKEQLLPGDAAWWLRAGLTAAVVVVGVALVTALYRAGREVRVP